MPLAAPAGLASLPRRLAGLFFSRLARAGASLFVGGVAAGLFGYVYQIVMGRMLSPLEYGLFSAMMALYAVLTTPFTTLTMVVARKVSEYRARSDNAAIARLYAWVNARTGIAGLIVLALFLVLAPQIQAYLKAADVIPVLILGGLVLFGCLPIINNAFLQGLQRFIWISATSAGSVILKIAFSAVLIWMGFGLAGAVGGGVGAAIVMWFITYLGIRDKVRAPPARSAGEASVPLKSLVPVFIANAAFAAMTQLDMVVVNYYFLPHDAGLYAAASVLGKAVLYLPGGIATALLPMVAENHARDEASAHLFLQAIALTALLCGGGALVYFVFGREIIVLLYGEGYRAAGDILKFFGFAVLPMALVLVAENFLIAKGRVLFAYLFLMMAPLQLIAIYLWHASFAAVMTVIGASGSVIVVIGFGLLLMTFMRSAGHGNTGRSRAPM